MPQGALLIHGFTATPECLDSLASPLRKAGFIVEAPLLPGHGTTVEDLLKTTWQEWYQTVIDSFKKLQGGSVCVAGLSLGGLLGLYLASEFPIDRLALLATPVFFTGFLERKVLPIFANSPLKKIYRYQRKWMGSAISDPEGRRRFKSYEEMPIQAIWEVVKLQRLVQGRLATVRSPTLILHSPHDNTAPFENMDYLKRHLGSRVIQTATLKRSNHVLTMDYERDRVAQEILEFFK